MKFNFTHKPETSQIEANLSFMMDDLEKMAIIETLTKVKDEFVKQAVQKIIDEHMQEVISKIDISTLVSTVYLKTALEMSKQLANTTTESK